MNLDLTRQTPFTTLLFLLLLVVLFWGGQLTSHNELVMVSHDVGTPLGRLLEMAVSRAPLVGALMAATLAFVNSMSITRLTISNVLFLERSYMPALIYLLISSGYFSSWFSLRPLLATAFLLLAIRAIFRSYNRRSLASGEYLIIGFFFGMACAVYAPAVYLLPLVFVGLLIFRLWDFREWLSAIVGACLPLFFSGYVAWLLGQDMATLCNSFVAELMTASGTMPSHIKDIDPLQWCFIGSIAVLFVLSIIAFIARHKEYKLKSYKAYTFFLWAMGAMVILMGVAPCRSLYMLPLLALPLAVIIPTFFNGRKPSFVSNFLYAMLIGSAVAMHLLPLLE